MTKIVMILTGFNPSTMEKYHLMGNVLVKNGAQVHMIGFSDVHKKREYFEAVYKNSALYSYQYGCNKIMFQGSNVFIKALNNMYMLFHFFVKFLSHLCTNRVDAIIIPVQPLEATLPSILLGKMFRVKVIPNIMEYYPAMPSFNMKKNFYIRWSWSLALNYSDAFIVISKLLAERIEQVTNKKIFRLPAILPNSAIYTHDKNTPSQIQSNHTLIYTSSSGYDELLEFCIKSLSLIRELEFIFVVTGRYPEEKISYWLTMCDQYGILDKVKFTGFLSDNELYYVQKSSLALLIPLVNNERHKARFPQKVLGYMQMGKPVVSTAVGEMAEYFEDGSNAILDSTISESGYAMKVESILTNTDLARSVGYAGKRYVEERFSSERLGLELYNFIKTVQ